MPQITPIIAKKPPERFFCRRCHAIITKEENDKAIKNKWIPLCKKCDPEIREKFEKWYPKFQQMKL